MVYSAVAAIHAISLFFISTSETPLSDRQSIFAGNTSASDSRNTSSPLWLNFTPSAVDIDIKVIGIIVVTALMALVPMQIYYNAYKNSNSEIVLILWGFLLFFGVYGSETLSFFGTKWHLRACPTGHEVSCHSQIARYIPPAGNRTELTNNTTGTRKFLTISAVL